MITVQSPDQQEYVLFLGYLLPRDLDFKYKQAFPKLQELGYPIVLHEGDMTHIVPKSDWEKVHKLIIQWNVKYKVNLTADFYECRTSDLKPANK